MNDGHACDACLARTPLVAADRAAFDPIAYRERCRDAELELVCGCDPAFPARLRALAAPPAVLHVRGEVEHLATLCAGEPVAIAGARSASAYGVEVARSLGRDLAAAGLTVVSGMALGIDTAAHQGALAGDGATIAVLAGGAEAAYPRANRALYRRILETGVAISEHGPGVRAHRWMFLERNRLVAALAAMTIVVEASEQSGSLTTARIARELGRPLGAVPGQVTSRQAAGALELLAGGATLVRNGQDVLDALYGAAAPELPRVRKPRRPADPGQAALLDALGEGLDLRASASRSGVGVGAVLATVAALELDGWVRRGAGGRYTVIPR